VRNPAVLNDLISAGTGALHLDPTLTPADMIDLGKRFKDFNADNLETYSIPVVGANKGGGSVLLMKTTEAEPTLDLFRGVDANAPDSILVVVQNGTTTADMAATAAKQLRTLGFSIPAGFTSNAERFDFAQTTIRYLPGGEERAQRVASYLVAPPVFEQVNFLLDADVSVVVGADWQGVRTSPGPTLPLPTTTSPPVTSRGQRTTTTTTTTVRGGSTSTGSTTSTTLGVVPQTPQDVRC
jgi:hypothetical protein